LTASDVLLRVQERVAHTGRADEREEMPMAVAHEITLTLTDSTVQADPETLTATPPIRAGDTVTFNFTGIGGRQIEVSFVRVDSLTTPPVSLGRPGPEGPFQAPLPRTSGSISGTITGIVAAGRMGRFYYHVFVSPLGLSGQQTQLQWAKRERLDPDAFGGIDIPGPPS
jgi:hypothetical protein